MGTRGTIRGAAAAVLLAVLVLGACGDDDDASSDDDAGVAGDGVEVVIEDFDFGEPVEVAPGEPVTFRNVDAADHQVAALDGSFATAVLGEGASEEVVLDEAGTYPYLCNIHPSMTGEIVVTG